MIESTGLFTKTAVIEGSFVKAFARYEDEWGYSNGRVELAARVASPGPAGVGAQSTRARTRLGG